MKFRLFLCSLLLVCFAASVSASPAASTSKGKVKDTKKEEATVAIEEPTPFSQRIQSILASLKTPAEKPEKEDKTPIFGKTGNKFLDFEQDRLKIGKELRSLLRFAFHCCFDRRRVVELGRDRTGLAREERFPRDRLPRRQRRPRAPGDESGELARAGQVEPRRDAVERLERERDLEQVRVPRPLAHPVDRPGFLTQSWGDLFPIRFGFDFAHERVYDSVPSQPAG